MNQSIRLSKAIKILIIILAALLFVAIWPANIIQQTYVSKSNEIMAMESDPVSVQNNVTQMFVGEGGELSAVDLYVCNDMRGETITFRLYDARYNEIFNTFHLVKDNQEFPGFVHIPVGYDLIKDQEYYFTLEGLTADMIVAYEDRETSTSIVNGFMSYGGIEIQRFNVIIRYEYSNPFAWWQVLILGVAIAAAASALIWSVSRLFEKKLTDKEVKVHTVFKAVLNPLVIIAGLALCLMIFPGRVFGSGMINYAFWGGSTILLMLVALYLINYKRLGDAPLINVDVLKANIPGYLQSFCIAMTIWYCFEYMNGLYEIHHTFAVRRMMIWFLLGIVCTYSTKELLTIWNGIYLVLAGVATYFYAKPYFGVEEEGDIYKLQAYILVIGGLVLVLLITNIIRFILKKDRIEKKVSVPYFVFFAVVLGMMIAFRNTRDWVTTMVVLFAIFYLRMWFSNKSDKLLTVFGNGVILNFIIMVCYSLMHRPFNRYRLFRYGLGYHTVTMTGVYLSLVLSVALVWFLLKYKKSKRLIDTWPQLLVLTVANVYQILTLSRTGYLASFITIVFIIIAFCCKMGTPVWKHMLKCFGSLVVATVLFCPIVFTMTRIIPSFWNDPIYADVEVFGHQVFKGTPKDSEYYIDIEYYWERTKEKLFNIVEEEEASAIFDTKKDLAYLCKEMAVQSHKLMKPEDVFVVDDSILVASAADEAENFEALDEMSNGRMEIFRDYIGQWNLTGHEDMGFEASFGGMHAHAHNVFLQIIHDHGLITGILFILFGITTFVLAMIRFYKRDDWRNLLIVSVVVAFAVSGMAEWNFHLCNPFGISLFMVVTPLLFKSGNVKENEQQ